MDLKKVQTVISAEEQHLASKSTKCIVKKTTKANTAVKTKLKDQIPSESYSFEGSNEMNEAIILNTTDTIDKNIRTSALAEKKTKSKKNRKGDLHNISVKTSFNKFDALQKRNLIHVRSSDTGKAQEIFNNPQSEKKSICRLCLKPVYKMEEIKAESSVFHKNCFRCHECSKQLKVDNYQSDSGTLYCLVHFKLLFAPKVVEDPEEAKPRKAELIIRESQPTELPPDVVRASDKQDLGLEELQQLNVRLRFQVFENAAQKKIENSPKPHIEVKSSKSILSKLAKLQQHGFAKNISFDFANCDTPEIDNNYTNSEEMELAGNMNADVEDIRSKKCVQRDRPIGMGEEALHDIKNKFENGHQSKEERREERKQEIQSIRSRLFMGKQAKIKEMYQQAVAESEQRVTSVGKKPIIETETEALSIKERFETGEMFKKKVKDTTENGGLPDEVDVFESAISKNSRSIFMELDANVASGKLPNIPDILQNQRSTQIKRHENHNEQENLHSNDQNAADVVKYDEKQEDIKIATSEISEKFKFFETYCPKESFRPKFRMTPPRDGVVKMPTPETDSELSEIETLFSDKVLQKTQTTSAMLNKFREMEQNKFLNSKKEDGPRPLKCFTPPPDGGRRLYQDHNSDEEESDSEDYESEDETQKRVSKTASTDESLKEAQAQARAKQLRAKFEKWQANEVQHELNEGQVNVYSQNVSDDSTIESTKTIRERFENLKSSEHKPSRCPRYQVNRFV